MLLQLPVLMELDMVMLLECSLQFQVLIFTVLVLLVILEDSFVRMPISSSKFSRQLLSACYFIMLKS